jgi:predicted HicB family RNase H-like nuclease
MDPLEFTYKGYRTEIDFCTEDRVYFGKVLELNDLVAFDGRNPEEVEQSFYQAVDEYLEMLPTIQRKV